MNYTAQIEYAGNGKYNALMYGERVIEGSSEPGLDLSRHLHEKGLHGLLTIMDGDQVRYTCNIEKAAALTVTTDIRGNTVFRKYRGK